MKRRNHNQQGLLPDLGPVSLEDIANLHRCALEHCRGDAVRAEKCVATYLSGRLRLLPKEPTQ